MKTADEIRKIFLGFFEKRKHKIVASSSLIPYDDESVLLTTAGMQQFKKYFTGEKDPLLDFGTQRACSVQKCFRTTDIEEIGDERHLTFFEMLGNFSFGPIGADDPNNFEDNSGYFKNSAVYWANEFLSQELGLRIDYVTIFKGEKDIPFDEETKKIWLRLGFPEEKIKAFGREDNFWGPTGDEGPCGPTTEIYIEDIEIWNIVFNEYYQEKNGKLKKLKNSGVDTGMGLERLLKVIEKKKTIFETSLFLPLQEVIFQKISDIDEKKLRIILDHLRGSVFLIADGLYPSNLDRGYILRRILRRLTLFLKLSNLSLATVDDLIKVVIQNYKNFYPEIDCYDKIVRVINEEMKNFERCLNIAFKKFDKIIKENEEAEVIGKKLFFLFSSFGLPLEIAKEIFLERNWSWSAEIEKTFDKLFKEHQKISRAKNA